jgi:hypothetical protein
MIISNMLQRAGVGGSAPMLGSQLNKWKKLGVSQKDIKSVKKGVDGPRYRTGADSSLTPVRLGNF